jgi:hypothetical protein
MPHNAANLIDREATTGWGGAASASHEKAITGANAMRSFLALSLLIALCASATAAHSRPRHHGHGYGGYSGGYYGGYSGHNSSQWGGQPD